MMPSYSSRDLRYHPVIAAARSLARYLGLWAVRQIVVEGMRSLWRNRVSTAFAVAIIALSLATVGAFLLVAQNLSVVLERATSLDLSVFLVDAISASAIEPLRQRISVEPGVLEVRYVSPDAALANFRRLNPDLAAIPEALGENPFPPSFEIVLTRDARKPTALVALAGRLTQIREVARLGQELELAQRAGAAARVARVIAVALGSVLILAALFTVSTVVRMTIYARRSEIELLQLVGATDAYVRFTFIAEGVIQGLAGSSIGWLLLLVAYRMAANSLGPDSLGIVGTLTSQFLTTSSVVLLVLSGGVLGAIGSLVPLRSIKR